MSTKFINVELLWSKLAEMEDSYSYPAGSCKFPFRLKGQGFFPGGDGLWREEDHLARSSEGNVSVGGVMFIGNDFGRLATFQKKRNSSYENPGTWRRLKARIRLVKQISEKDLRGLSFFTNAFMGLRCDGKSALDPKDWKQMPDFCNFCADFLEYQLETIEPKLVVLMGPKAQEAFCALVAKKPILKVLDVFKTSHPYGDFGFKAERKHEDAKLLGQAWTSV